MLCCVVDGVTTGWPCQGQLGLSWTRCSSFCPGVALGYLSGSSTPAAICMSQTAVSEYSLKVQIKLCLFGPTWDAFKQAKVRNCPEEVVGVSSREKGPHFGIQGWP